MEEDIVKFSHLLAARKLTLCDEVVPMEEGEGLEPRTIVVDIKTGEASNKGLNQGDDKARSLEEPALGKGKEKLIDQSARGINSKVNTLGVREASGLDLHD
ncbi:hypothetical protein GOP47_0029450 [Adiantum capillus-veneris]|nr:hypothetical protein GOP47_0029450 [Adiantum capillus-veneris]